MSKEHNLTDRRTERPTDRPTDKVTASHGSEADKGQNAITRQIRRLRNLLIFLLCIVLIGGLGAGACGWKLYKKVKGQETTLQNLQLQINTITTNQKAAAFDSTVFKTDTYNYLAIGNSITYHDAMSYWWNQGVGMAASDAEHDYVHVLTSLLKDGGEEVVAANMNFYDWEAQGYDRGETLSTLDSYLSPNLDLVTIQLGENVNDTSTLEKDYEDLINYVSEKAPEAQVVVIGEFWKDEEKDNDKKAACDATGATFVDLSSMWNDMSFEAGMGTTVYGSDGEAHTIEHDGVASHPGDKGMQKIAELTYEAINKN